MSLPKTRCKESKPRNPCCLQTIYGNLTTTSTLEESTTTSRVLHLDHETRVSRRKQTLILSSLFCLNGFRHGVLLDVFLYKSLSFPLEALDPSQVQHSQTSIRYLSLFKQTSTQHITQDVVLHCARRSGCGCHGYVYQHSSKLDQPSSSETLL